MNKILFYLAFTLIFGYKGNSQTSINLEAIDTNFSPSNFVAPFKEHSKNLNNELDVLSQKIFDQKNATKQDTLTYKKINLELSEINIFKTDTLFHLIDKEKMWSDENIKKWAISYDMMSYSSLDSTAHFRHIYFPKVSFVENLEGQLVVLSATTSYQKPNPKEFEEFYKLLSKKFGEPQKRKIRSLGKDKYTFEWIGDKFVYQMVSHTNEASFKENKHNLRFYVVHKEYNDFVKGKISSGDWIDLK
ncbi:hypothetical protein [Aquimarina sp. SS2-1]|uniref:hypothetical protein n=1 Tax=Aquimarina besae TaxID=3342247 RepID=UPI00366C4141